MTEPAPRRSRAWKRLIPWAVFFLVLVLVLPVVSFVRNRARSGEPGAPERPLGAVFDAGRVYSATEVARFRLGPGADGVALNAGEPAIETVLPAPDGGYWLIDRPEHTKGGARVRRLDAGGRIVRTFTTEFASTLFTPAPDGGMWYDVAAGGGKVETFVRVDASGKEVARFELPPALYARNICLAADGAAFAQAEEWLIDPEAKKAVYSSYLVPIADANGRLVDKPLRQGVVLRRRRPVLRAARQHAG